MHSLVFLNIFLKSYTLYSYLLLCFQNIYYKVMMKMFPYKMDLCNLYWTLWKINTGEF